MRFIAILMWIPGFMLSLAAYLNSNIILDWAKQYSLTITLITTISITSHILLTALSFWLWKKSTDWFGSIYEKPENMFYDKNRLQYFLNGTVVMLSLVVAFDSMMRTKISACNCGCEIRTVVMHTAWCFLAGYSLTQLIKGWAFSWVKKLDSYTKRGLRMMFILIALNSFIFFTCITEVNNHHFPLFMYMPVYTAWFTYFCTRYKNKDCWIYPLAYYSGINFWIHLWGVSETLASNFFV